MPMIRLIPEENPFIPIRKADYPLIFPYALEFCPPVYETWNIVHIGMLIPEAHQIYVCGTNCMRGVTMTAAEMGQSRRFHCVVLQERDLLVGNLEEKTLAGVCDVLQKLDQLPPAVLVFPVCVHRFLSCDMDYVYRELESRYPGVNFLRCWMDPVNQKNGAPPDVTLRQQMVSRLPLGQTDPRLVGYLGSDLPLDEQGELFPMLADKTSGQVLEFPRLKSYEEYRTLGRCGKLAVSFDPYLPPAKALADLYGDREILWLYPGFDYAKITYSLTRLSRFAGRPMPDIASWERRADFALAGVRKELDGRPVWLDYTAHTRPLGLARLLLSHGINLQRIYIDKVGPEEEDFLWLQRNYPEFPLYSTNRVQLRTLPRDGGDQVLAIGPKAAYYAGTSHFVNWICSGGAWGFGGIVALCTQIRRALAEEKDLRRTVTHKGLGWPACRI